MAVFRNEAKCISSLKAEPVQLFQGVKPEPEARLFQSLISQSGVASPECPGEETGGALALSIMLEVSSWYIFPLFFKSLVTIAMISPKTVLKKISNYSPLNIRTYSIQLFHFVFSPLGIKKTCEIMTFSNIFWLLDGLPWQLSILVLQTLL